MTLLENAKTIAINIPHKYVYAHLLEKLVFAMHRICRCRQSAKFDIGNYPLDAVHRLGHNLRISASFNHIHIARIHDEAPSMIVKFPSTSAKLIMETLLLLLLFLLAPFEGPNTTIPNTITLLQIECGKGKTVAPRFRLADSFIRRRNPLNVKYPQQTKAFAQMTALSKIFWPLEMTSAHLCDVYAEQAVEWERFSEMRNNEQKCSMRTRQRCCDACKSAQSNEAYRHRTYCDKPTRALRH